MKRKKVTTRTTGHFSALRSDIRILGKVWRLQPSYIVCLAVYALTWAFINSLAVYFRSAMFNALDNGTDFWGVAVYILSLALFYLLIFIPDHLYRLIWKPVLERKLRFRMHRELYCKAQRMDLACYDDPDFYNQFIWAMRESDTRAIQVVEAIGNVVNHLLSSLAIIGLLFTVNVWISILMLAGNLVAAFVVDLIGNRMWIRYDTEQNPRFRRQDYIDRVFNLPDYAKELRSGQVADMMIRDQEKTTGELEAANRRTGVKATLLYGVLYNVAKRGTYYGTILIMIGDLAAGRVLLGGFAAAVSALWILQSTMQSLSDALAELPRHALYLEKYFAFLDHENQLVSGTEEVPPFQTLTFENVSFSYAPVKTEKETALQQAVVAYEIKKGEKRDGEEQDTDQGTDRGGEVLHGINLTIRKGEKTAIVGYNGAGKTTLIKLIMRLYDPTEGRILYNGIDIHRFDLEAYRARIGAVFQDYRLFAATVAENVMGGRYDGQPGTEAEVRAALDAASFTGRLSTLEQGLHTPLTREIDQSGVNLSGGEAQKVAIARVFVRPYDLIIMDEPSSALDPVAEYELNHSILNAADSRERTVIFISHRLSTTRFADRILLFADGRLCEQGSHEVLMAMGGRYARMFDMQAEKYRAGEAWERTQPAAT